MLVAFERYWLSQHRAHEVWRHGYLHLDFKPCLRAPQGPRQRTATEWGVLQSLAMASTAMGLRTTAALQLQRNQRASPSWWSCGLDCEMTCGLLPANLWGPNSHFSVCLESKTTTTLELVLMSILLHLACYSFFYPTSFWMKLYSMPIPSLYFGNIEIALFHRLTAGAICLRMNYILNITHI